MIKYVYVVHSKLNEDFVRDEFETAEDAIAYAEENQDQGTSVEQVEVDVNDFGEVTEVGDSEIIWDVPEVEDALISDDDYPEIKEDDIEFSEDDLAELDADYADVSEEELAALEAEHEDEFYAEADMMDTLEDQAMAEAEHPVDEAMKVKDNKLVIGDEEMVDEEQALKAAEPVTDEKTVKAAIDDRVDSAEKKMETAIKDMDLEKEVDTVCKDTKIILHSEDDVKDLQEADRKDYRARLDELEARLVKESLAEAADHNEIYTVAKGVNTGLVVSKDTPILSRYEFDLESDNLDVYVEVNTEGGDIIPDNLPMWAPISYTDPATYSGTVDSWSWSHTLTAKELVEFLEQTDRKFTQEQLDSNNSIDLDVLYDAIVDDDDFMDNLAEDNSEEAEDEILEAAENGDIDIDQYGLEEVDNEPDYYDEYVDSLIDEECTKQVNLKESLLHEGVSAEAVAVVSALLQDEWEAISGYEDAAAKLEKLDVEDKEKVLHVLDHISEEESIHVGQLEQIVKLLNPEHIAKQDEGHEEGAEELAGEDPHEEEISVEEPEVEVVEESLVEALDDEYRAALKKAIPLLKKDGVFAVVLGYDQGKGYTYLDKPLIKKSLKELQEFQNGFKRGKEATKVTVRTVYPDNLEAIEELLAEDNLEEAITMQNAKKQDQFIPQADGNSEHEADFIHLAKRFVDYTKNGEACDPMSDPKVMTPKIMNQYKLVRYYFIAKLLKWEELIKALEERLDYFKYTKAMIDEIDKYINDNKASWEADYIAAQDYINNNLTESVEVNSDELDYDKLREELEDNEDEVECQVCFNIVPKEDAIKTDGGYYVCKHCFMEEDYNPLLDDTLFDDVQPVADTEEGE